jgi:hypothetical protein
LRFKLIQPLISSSCNNYITPEEANFMAQALPIPDVGPVIKTIFFRVCKVGGAVEIKKAGVKIPPLFFDERKLLKLSYQNYRTLTFQFVV